MNYNNKKKIKIKTVQIDNKELEKCKSGKEFKVKLITKSGPIIIDPPKPPRDMPRWFKVWTQTEFQSVKTDIAGVKTELTNVIKLNNLKH